MDKYVRTLQLRPIGEDANTARVCVCGSVLLEEKDNGARGDDFRMGTGEEC